MFFGIVKSLCAYFHGHGRRLLAVWRHEIAQEESPYYADEEFIASNTFFYSIAERARELSSVDAVGGISGVDDHLHRRNFSRTCSMCKSRKDCNKRPKG